jgi:hypothetical protein
MVGRLVHFAKMPAFRLLGRRGLLLLMFGLLWTCYGTAILFAELPPRFSEVPFPILSVLDGTWTGILWAGFGLIAVVVSFARTHHKGKDYLGFNALLTPPFVWTLSYTWSAILWMTTDGFGKSTAGVSLIVWLIVCAFVMLVADWPDPDDPVFRAPEAESGTANNGTDLD